MSDIMFLVMVGLMLITFRFFYKRYRLIADTEVRDVE